MQSLSTNVCFRNELRPWNVWQQLTPSSWAFWRKQWGCLSRSVFWQQASFLRNDLQLLRAEHPVLAKELENIGQRLDAGNFSDLSAATEEPASMQALSKDTGKERCRLVGLWEELVEKVRQLPKFEHFLKPIPFHQLRQTAAVVNPNATNYRVDALSFGTTGAMNHIPITGIDLAALDELTSNMSPNRPVNATPRQRQRYVKQHMKPVLRLIWTEVRLRDPASCGC